MKVIDKPYGGISEPQYYGRVDVFCNVNELEVYVYRDSLCVVYVKTGIDEARKRVIDSNEGHEHWETKRQLQPYAPVFVLESELHIIGEKP